MDTCGGCKFITVPELDVVKHLQKGADLRIYLKMNNERLIEQPSKLCVTDTGPYVAISHVWAQGRKFYRLLENAIHILTMA